MADLTAGEAAAPIRRPAQLATCDSRGRAPRRAALDRAGEGELSFLAAPKYAPLFAASRAGLTLVAPSWPGVAPGPSARA